MEPFYWGIYCQFQLFHPLLRFQLLLLLLCIVVSLKSRDIVVVFAFCVCKRLQNGVWLVSCVGCFLSDGHKGNIGVEAWFVLLNFGHCYFLAYQHFNFCFFLVSIWSKVVVVGIVFFCFHFPYLDYFFYFVVIFSKTCGKLCIYLTMSDDTWPGTWHFMAK